MLFLAPKRCIKCRELKDESEFGFRENKHRANTCKACVNIKHRSRYHANPAGHKAYQKAWIEKNRERVVARNKVAHRRRVQVLEGYLSWAAKNKRTECRRRKLPCDITFESLFAMYSAQDGKCALTGRTLQCGRAGQQRDTLSIDRIEAGGGYTMDNIRLVTYQANMARGQFSDDELLALARDIQAHTARQYFSVTLPDGVYLYNGGGESAGLVM